MKKPIYVLILILLFIVSGCNFNESILSYNTNEIGNMDNTLHFIDVGQGDSILVSSGNEYMLVDGGEEDQGDTVVNYIDGLGIDKLKYIVATHPHSDHIGGIDDVMNSINVENVIMPDAVSGSRCFENMLDAIEDNNINVIKGEAGYSFNLGNFKCDIVGPVNISDDANNNSVVMKLSYGEDSILLTGDCSKAEEKDIIENGADISAVLLKSGHHGSSTSSTEDFIRKVNPKTVVISCGKNNSYGHPHKETIATYNKYGIKVYRTDQEGTIIAYCSGKGITIDSKNIESNITNKKANEADSFNSIEKTYILNKSSKKYHTSECSGGQSISGKNKEEYTGTAKELEEMGYSSCGTCKPE